jgi:hypothetical protein
MKKSYATLVGLVVLALPLATVAAATVGCSAILGVYDIEPPLDGGADPVDAMACLTDGDLGNPCALCQDQQCCGPYLACHDDTSCQGYEACVKACGAQGSSSSTCTLQCAAQNQDGHALFAPSFACVNDHCFAQCSGDQADPCDSCLHASCADSEYACQSDPDCDILQNCNESCGGSSDFVSCTQVCTNNAPESTQKLWDAFESCSATYCTASCGE